MQTCKFNQVFSSFEAVHVGSKDDTVIIQQGDDSITLPADLVPVLIEALNLAHHQEL